MKKPKTIDEAAYWFNLGKLAASMGNNQYPNTPHVQALVRARNVEIAKLVKRGEIVV